MRTFVAIEITDQKVLDSIKKIQSEFKINAKPVQIKNIHFTLQFLGEISDQKSKDVQATLNSVDFFEFDVGFVGVGAFPRPKFPRVIWIGTDDKGGKELINLAKKVNDVLLPLGFKNDKPFKPHVTIFRIKNKVRNISAEMEKFRNFSFGVQKISEIKFKKSVLTTEGPIYSDLQVVKAKK